MLVELSKVVQGDIEWTEADIFMEYFNKQGYWYTQTVMPKFIMLSGHYTMTSAVELFFKHNNLFQNKVMKINFSAMYMFNFYECLSCESDERFFIDFSLYPHTTVDDESSVHIFRMSTGDFIKIMNDAIDRYIEKFELKSNDLAEICAQDYVKV